MRNFKQIATIIFAFSLAACSQQWMDSDPGVSGGEVYESLTNLTLTASSQGSGGSLSSEILQNPNTSIYYGHGPSTMGPAFSIVAFPDLSYLSPSLIGYTDFDIAQAEVFFVDGFDDSLRRHFFLGYKITLKDTGQEISALFSAQDAEFTDTEFIATFKTSHGTLRVKTQHLQEGVKDFSGVIQLKAYSVNNGDESIVGKFSVLVGFSG